MKEIKLDPKKLLGFKAVSANGATVRDDANVLHRAKIGVKTEITRQS